ncbi:MAG: UDPGP type 1 family protein [Planctomycetes bacterium]|jgi:UDP-N-acetylglucosamine/UDP-N-acetylgalactosamine diphosphorylase|nr:UDPGP type 1 family protein [Planctomycetota bacterium]
MTGKKEIESLRPQLAQRHQEHLLAFWPQLDPRQRQELLDQIRELDLAKIDEWVEQLVTGTPIAEVAAKRFEPAPSYGAEPRDTGQRRKYRKAMELGDKLIAQGKVAALVVAGGQGVRLGFEGPKGNFPISPVRQKTLFRLFAETIQAVSRRYGTICPWYVMTSPLNHAQTVEVFQKENYYGLDPQDVFIFQQGTLPSFGLDGRILLTDKAQIARSPDGHGGCIRALARSGALADMKKRGIDYISYWQVDNPLVRLFDPLFIGLHALDGAEMSSKAVIKNAPKEKVGNFCRIEGRVNVIEYSDLPDELAEKRRPDGTLVFELGSIAIHIINTELVERLNAQAYSLPLHRAVKKIPYIDPQGHRVQPKEPNGVKLESFIFDALPLARESIILEIVRSEQFAPTKNAEGDDSVRTTRAMMVERAAAWLESAGVQVPRQPDGSADCLLEIAPSFALDPADVAAKRHVVPELQPGDQLYLQ